MIVINIFYLVQFIYFHDSIAMCCLKRSFYSETKQKQCTIKGSVELTHGELFQGLPWPFQHWGPIPGAHVLHWKKLSPVALNSKLIWLNYQHFLDHKSFSSSDSLRFSKLSADELRINWVAFLCHSYHLVIIIA